jgi:hypothetical protein
VAHGYSSRHLDHFYFLPREFTCAARSKSRRRSIRASLISRLIRYQVSDRRLDVSLWFSDSGVQVRHREGSNLEHVFCSNHLYVHALLIRTANSLRRN